MNWYRFNLYPLGLVAAGFDVWFSILSWDNSLGFHKNPGPLWLTIAVFMVEGSLRVKRKQDDQRRVSEELSR